MLEYNKLLIHTSDGVTRSGLFSTLWNVLSRLTSDKEIDVYMAVRETHSVIPHAMTSLVRLPQRPTWIGRLKDFQLYLFHQMKFKLIRQSIILNRSLCEVNLSKFNVNKVCSK